MRNEAHKFAPHFIALLSDHLHQPLSNLEKDVRENFSDYGVKEVKLRYPQYDIEVIFSDGSVLTSDLSCKTTT